MIKKKKKKKLLVKIFCRLIIQYLNLNSAYIKHELKGNNCEETLLVKILLYLLKKFKKERKKKKKKKEVNELLIFINKISYIL